MSKALEKAKELAKKTNAAVVVVNETTDDAFVILGLDEYEKLVDRELGIKNQELGSKVEAASTRFEQSSRSLGTGKPQEVDSERGDRHAPIAIGARDDRRDADVARLTEDELLAKINQEIGEWREGQVDKQNILLAEMPAQLSLKNDKGNERGGYNLVGAKVDFRVDNLEEEERYFLEPLD